MTNRLNIIFNDLDDEENELFKNSYAPNGLFSLSDHNSLYNWNEDSDNDAIQQSHQLNIHRENALAQFEKLNHYTRITRFQTKVMKKKEGRKKTQKK
jgi:hypothetical protein